MTLLSTTTLSGSSTTISSIDQGYNNLFIQITGVTTASAGLFRYKINNVTGVTDFVLLDASVAASAATYSYLNTDPYLGWGNSPSTTSTNNSFVLQIYDYANSGKYKIYAANYGYEYSSGYEFGLHTGIYKENTAVSSINFFNGSTLNSGTVKIYGVK
jgi:hypothetical protein